MAEEYDSIYLKLGYYDHLKCLEIAEKFIPDEKRKEFAVFDMGCGTGLVGEVMHTKGFENISGCDASPGILAVAAKKNNGKAYVSTLELFLGQPDKYPEDLKGKFDVITASGILA